MGKKYKHIFFDLDGTLWDFEKNSSDTLRLIRKKFNLESNIPDEDEFVNFYICYNDKLWDDFRAGRVKKEELRTERFRLVFEKYGLADPELIHSISKFYSNTCPVLSAVIPGTHELLKYLHTKYTMSIISNGFYDVQLSKMKSSGISKYFYKLYTSDIIGFAKPNKKIYEYAISSSNARKVESIMVGDDLTNDILGSYKAGIDQVWFNYKNIESEFNPTYEIRNLKELMDIL